MKQIKVFILVFVSWILVGMISKVLFIVCYHSMIGEAGMADYAMVLWHGMILDAAIAGYLTIIPGILLILSLWWNGKAMRWLWDGYFIVTAFISAVAYISNLGLYGYWGFPLDNTPLLYLKTSPADALASMTWWQWIVLPLAGAALSIGIFFLFHTIYRKGIATAKSTGSAKSTGYATALVLLTAALIIPIRGGFGTGTNHTGSVYFSNNTRLNHAAVNPIFCFVESVMHQEEIGTKYRYMKDGEAMRIFSTMTYTKLRGNAVKHRYNVVVICLESFSKYIMTETGHVKGVTPCLDRLSQEGIYFTNFYANSFRTDRALVSVLSGLPAQPTMSVMDIPHLSTSLPSLAKSLSRNGYDTHFYYGGDTNYSNMKSYIVGTGYGNTTAEYDFPEKLRTCKWGVADEHVYSAMLQDIKTSKTPFLKTIMTESSHEPFDVPYKSGLSPELNAFAYADHCLGNFIKGLKALPAWKNTLVVIVPDHLGVYPADLDNYKLWRYEIPLIMTGGMVEEPKKVNVIGSQIDICATVLGILGIDHSDFIYSKDLFDPAVPHFAFFDIPDAIGMVDESGFMYYDNTAQKIITSNGSDVQQLCTKAKAYTQKLYDDLEARSTKR